MACSCSGGFWRLVSSAFHLFLPLYLVLLFLSLSIFILSKLSSFGRSTIRRAFAWHSSVRGLAKSGGILVRSSNAVSTASAEWTSNSKNPVSASGKTRPICLHHLIHSFVRRHPSLSIFCRDFECSCRPPNREEVIGKAFSGPNCGSHRDLDDCGRLKNCSDRGFCR